MMDDAFMEFLSESGDRAEYVTSVCTGALLIGAAGFLRGRRATTHWAYCDLLADCGAIYEKARVVRDGNIFTGGGVTAGVDFAFTIAKELHGEEVAAGLQLGLEYDPAPPMDCGHPDKAAPAIHSYLKTFYAPAVADTQAALKTRYTS
jgi:cyclohexyl-isocyanide hydratase